MGSLKGLGFRGSLKDLGFRGSLKGVPIKYPLVARVPK